MSYEEPEDELSIEAPQTIPNYPPPESPLYRPMYNQ